MSKTVDLESMIAHQDKQIQELNEVVTAQAGEIDSLKKYVKIKLDKIESNINDAGQEAMSVADEAAANKPPHY